VCSGIVSTSHEVVHRPRLFPLQIDPQNWCEIRLNDFLSLGVCPDASKLISWIVTVIETLKTESRNQLVQNWIGAMRAKKNNLRDLNGLSRSHKIVIICIHICIYIYVYIYTYTQIIDWCCFYYFLRNRDCTTHDLAYYFHVLFSLKHKWT